MREISVAVCVSGEIRGNPQKTFEQMRKFFPNARYLYCTWLPVDFDSENPTPLDLPEGEDIGLHDRPIINYHPYGDMMAYARCARLEDKIPKFMADPKEVERTSHQTKQIIAHANMVRDNPGYDVYVRSRWDIKIHDNADMMKYVEDAYDNERAIGFGSPMGTWGKESDATGPYRDFFIMDQMIIHSAKVFDPQMVYDMTEEKKLIAAEWGWWQVMSQHSGDNHRCIQGIANKEAHV